MSKTSPLREGEEVQLATLEDVLQAFVRLPKDRGEVLLQEVGEAIRYYAGLREALGLIGATCTLGPITWINDTKGEKTINLFTEDDDPIVTLKVKP